MPILSILASTMHSGLYVSGPLSLSESSYINITGPDCEKQVYFRSPIGALH